MTLLFPNREQIETFSLIQENRKRTNEMGMSEYISRKPDYYFIFKYY